MNIVFHIIKSQKNVDDPANPSNIWSDACIKILKTSQERE